MTNNTTRPTDEGPTGQETANTNNDEPRSLISKVVSKWLKPSRPAGDGGEPAATAEASSAVQEQSGEETQPMGADPGNGAEEGAKPRRPRKRSGSSRRRRKKAALASQEGQPDQESVGDASRDADDEPASGGAEAEGAPQDQPVADGAEPRKKRGSRGRGRKSAKAKGTKETASSDDDDAEELDDEPEAVEPASKVKRDGSLRLLINTDEPEECRVALLENGRVESFYVEIVGQAQTKGNIYKGRVTAVEPNLQAVFVDYGTEKNGFLPFGDVHPEYYSKDVGNTHWKDLRIQEVISKGQEMLVEVVKEATGNKGATLTTFLSMPGRYLVLMPGSDSAGISRKIESEAERNKLREMIAGVNIPEGIGYIVRTASQEITKTALAQDVRFLLNLWKDIKKKGQTEKAPALLHRDQDIIARFLRDHFTSDIKEILVDDQEALIQVQAFLDLLPAAQRKATVAKLHRGSQPLFHQYHVEKQIEQIFQPTVPLPSGGSIVINPTEALVSIDVNSGRTGKDRNFEDAIFLANMEAAEELARQLRLRDLGGLIVVDFIDMRDSKHIREVEKKVRDCMKRDKAKVDFSKISKFGLMQISRQKMAAPVAVGSYRLCPHCQGRGTVRSVETQALAHLRHIQTGVTRRQVKKVQCVLPLDVAQYILNRKRADLVEMEQTHRVEISIIPDPGLPPNESKIDFLKE